MKRKQSSLYYKIFTLEYSNLTANQIKLREERQN